MKKNVPSKTQKIVVPAAELDDFDSLEAKIRGEEILLGEEYRKAKEERAIKEELKEHELTKRLKQLKEAIHNPSTRRKPKR